MSTKVKSLLYAITLYGGISPMSLNTDHSETTVSSADHVRDFVIIPV